MNILLKWLSIGDGGLSILICLFILLQQLFFAKNFKMFSFLIMSILRTKDSLPVSMLKVYFFMGLFSMRKSYYFKQFNF